MSLDYLAKYLNKDEAKPKKRKRTGTRIVEDDIPGWTTETVSRITDEPTIVEQGDAVQSKVKFKSAYVDVEAGQAGNDTSKASPSDAQMEDGAKAGLRTKEQLKADMRAHREAAMAMAAANKSIADGREHETVYRDATGRRIDIALARQEKLRELKRTQDEEKKQRSMMQGLVQQNEHAARLKEIQKVGDEGFSRYAGNDTSEAYLKRRERWDDPAAGFLTKVDQTKSNGATTTARRPTYKGGFAPNRYGISPGYRWDGVDRGNGYEARRFKEIASQNQRRQEYNEWSKEDL